LAEEETSIGNGASPKGAPRFFKCRLSEGSARTGWRRRKRVLRSRVKRLKRIHGGVAKANVRIAGPSVREGKQALGFATPGKLERRRMVRRFETACIPAFLFPFCFLHLSEESIATGMPDRISGAWRWMRGAGEVRGIALFSDVFWGFMVFSAGKNLLSRAQFGSCREGWRLRNWSSHRFNARRRCAEIMQRDESFPGKGVCRMC
jgi:hypothetical protein